MKLKNNKYITFLIVFYLFSNIPLFINTGVFWDDWAIYKMSVLGLEQQFVNNGSFYMVFVHKFLNSFGSPPIIYGVLTIILQLFTFGCIYKILHYFEKKHIVVNIISGLFLLIPYALTKNTMICFPYTLCNFFFFLAFFLVIKDKKNILNRLLALVFFFLSFITNSLLFFYIIPLSIIYFREIGTINSYKIKDLKKIINFKILIKNIDLFLLPFVFYFIKITYLSPTGFYKENSYNTMNFNDMHIRLLDSFKKSFIGLFSEVINTFSGLTFFWVLLIIFFSIVYFFFKTEKKENFIKHKYLFFIGLLTFLIGAFPYCLVNKTPTFSGFDTRHQLLLPLGSVLMIYSITLYFFKKNQQFLIFNLIIIAFGLTTFKKNLEYYRGALKQESIVLNIDKNRFDDKYFLVNDVSKDLNEVYNNYTYYAYAGLIKNTFRREDQFMATFKEYYQKEKEFHFVRKTPEMYNLTDVLEFKEPKSVIKIDNGSYPLTLDSTIKMMFFKYFWKEKYKKNVKNVVEISYLNYTKKEAEFYLKDL